MWMPAKADTAYYDNNQANVDEECEVMLDQGLIKVRYEDEDGNEIIYSGQELSEGHYELRCPELSGHATLHRFQNSKILEGSWVEKGTRGFWRIVLLQKLPGHQFI